MNSRAQIDDSWWETVVANLLPPSQFEVIQVLIATEKELTAGELASALQEKGLESARIDHHLTRLRSLHAIDLDRARRGGPTKYRLVEKPRRGLR